MHIFIGALICIFMKVEFHLRGLCMCIIFFIDFSFYYFWWIFDYCLFICIIILSILLCINFAYLWKMKLICVAYIILCTIYIYIYIYIMNIVFLLIFHTIVSDEYLIIIYLYYYSIYIVMNKLSRASVCLFMKDEIDLWGLNMHLVGRDIILILIDPRTL